MEYWRSGGTSSYGYDDDFRRDGYYTIDTYLGTRERSILDTNMEYQVHTTFI